MKTSISFAALVATLALAAPAALVRAQAPAPAAVQPDAPGAPLGHAAGRPASAYSAQVAVEWYQLSLQLVQQTPGFSPPVAARALAYMSLALYESVLPGMPTHRSLAGQLNDLDSLPWAQPDETLQWPTVANAALATMARMMFPTATAEWRTRIDLLERSLPLKYPQDFDPAELPPEVVQRSENFGRLMAMALMTWARTDGGHEAWGPLRRSRTPCSSATLLRLKSLVTR